MTRASAGTFSGRSCMNARMIRTCASPMSPSDCAAAVSGSTAGIGSPPMPIRGPSSAAVPILRAASVSVTCNRFARSVRVLGSANPRASPNRSIVLMIVCSTAGTRRPARWTSAKNPARSWRLNRAVSTLAIHDRAAANALIASVASSSWIVSWATNST